MHFWGQAVGTTAVNFSPWTNLKQAGVAGSLKLEALDQCNPSCAGDLLLGICSRDPALPPPVRSPWPGTPLHSRFGVLHAAKHFLFKCKF